MENFIERDCTIEIGGKVFESGGASVCDNRVVGYLKEGGILTTWHGEKLGTWRKMSEWKTPHSFVSSTMMSVECFVGGVRFVGRSAGVGMSISAKLSPRQRKGK
jgi:hypothetical protein